MKKFFLLVAASLFLGAPMMAQTKVNVNKDAILAKIAKSDADIANPKKNTKAATWITRASALMDAETAVLGNVFKGQPLMTANLMFGNGQDAGQVKKGNNTFTKIVYPYFDAYTDGSSILSWEITYIIRENAIDEALECYEKAKELGAADSKIQPGLKEIYNTFSKKAEAAYNLGEYKTAGEYFQKAYAVSALSYSGIQPDYYTASNAGVSYLLCNEYQASYDNLKIARDNGEEQDGDVYYYIYHAYKGLANGDKEKLAGVEENLTTGLNKYPNNTKIIECMIDLYVELSRDPSTIVTTVKEAIDKDPKNADLWIGLGRVYDQLGDTDSSIDAFKHVAELTPNDYTGYWCLGLLYIRKGDAAVDELNKKTFSGQSEYDAALDNAMSIYYEALAPLEKAHELNPSEITYLEYLKNLCFRLRDYKDGIMDKYTKYNEEFKASKNQ